MKYKNIYDDYDDIDELRYEKIKKGNSKKKKFKGKGHQTKYGRGTRPTWDDDWGDIEIPELLDKPKTSVPDIVVTTTPPKKEVTTPSVFTPNEEYTQEIKGYKIDFSRLSAIEKVDQEHEGKQTYGIRFVFAGKKGLYRIIWYNTNKKLRDKILEEKTAYWQTIFETGK